ncbi:hypothetical protein ACMFMG_008543 [Clarireedia jacksonii]
MCLRSHSALEHCAANLEATQRVIENHERSRKRAPGSSKLPSQEFDNKTREEDNMEVDDSKAIVFIKLNPNSDYETVDPDANPRLQRKRKITKIRNWEFTEGQDLTDPEFAFRDTVNALHDPAGLRQPNQD